jgi:anthranilate phosphoribosyltransferase
VTDTQSTDFDIAPLLGDVFDGQTLSQERAEAVMGHLMDGELSQMQAAALLAALRTRGETVDEVIGFARAMRERAVRVPVRVSGPLLDTCGTGGTGVNTFNYQHGEPLRAGGGRREGSPSTATAP